MQVLQDNFYHSNSRLGADENLQDDRQLLVEEQKLCRVRARKFSHETNRRRKLLEDKRKQWDVQEQRLRENVLQQRRHLVLDATERFQRAHLPPSQRRRQSFRRHVPNIEDALNQIQGTLGSYNRQSSFLSSNSNNSRNCTPSPRPPTVSKSSHRQALSAVEAYTKLLQEQSTCVKNSQETQNTQDHSPQDNHLSYCCNSDSLSSKDSLENEEANHSTTFSAMTHLGDDLLLSRKQYEPKQKKQEETEGLNNKMNVSKAPWGFTSIEQTYKTPETQPARHNCSLLTLEIISGEPEHCDVNFPQNSTGDNIMVTSKAAPDNTLLESSCLKRVGQLLDLRQQRVHDDRQQKHPSASEILLPAKNGNSNDILFVAPPPPNIFLNDSATDNASQDRIPQQTGKERYCLSSQKELTTSTNNLNKVSNSEPKTEKPVNTASLPHACLSNIQSDAHKCLKYPEEEVQKLPVSMGSSRSICEVRFIKGILKKQSKYMSGDTTCMYGSGHLIFAKQVALAIRDSVELTRTKTKEEGNNTVKKKLRWFDEVQKEDKEQTIIKQMKGKSSNLSQTNNNSEDHQLSVTTVSGASKPGPSMTLSASTGYHFTKQAWADVGVQVNLPQERVDEVKVLRCNTRTGGPKVPRRERSTRVGAGPVSSRTRKGIVIRPQSATEVSQIAKTQGKIMVPRPPPRVESMEEKTAYITKTPYGVDHASVNCKQAPAAEHKDNSEGLFSPCTHHVIRTDTSVMYTPYTYPVSEGNMKGMASSGHQDTLSCSRRRGMVYDVKGLCLDCTPTDEEISQLWQGVCSALVTKNAKNVFRRQAVESERVGRKLCVEPPGSKNRKPPQPSQPPKQAINPIRLYSKTYDMAFPEEGLESAAQFHPAEVHAEGLQEERDTVAATETVQQRQQGLTTISLEEQKILLSLDRLNHQLHFVREHVGGNTGARGLVLIDAPSTKEIKATNHHKHRASSANNRNRYQKKV
ncbi:hypothetical protein PAMA_020209 [Pampus argenteus]